MKYAVALSALVALAAATPKDLNQRQAGDLPPSYLGVLATALPSSLIQEALTNSDAVSSEIASQFAAGMTPSWYSALPSDVKTYLAGAASTPSAAISQLSSAATATAGGAFPPAMTGPAMSPYTPMGTPMGTPMMTPMTPMTPTSTSSSEETSETGESSTSGSGGVQSTRAGGSSSSSAAAVPAHSAAWGMGIAGAAGVVGLLAL